MEDLFEYAKRIDEVQAYLAEENVTVWEVDDIHTDAIELHFEDPKATIEQARDQGVSEFYVLTGDGDSMPGIAFYHNSAYHVARIDAESTGGSGDQMDNQQDDAETESSPEAEQETETAQQLVPWREKREPEDMERREELASELLQQYSEYLDEDEIYQLENSLEVTSVPRLLDIKEKVQREARADPDLEQDLAEWLAQDERFNRQFNETDTEMLIKKERDINFDHIRIDEVHTMAKSLLKID
jgi:hypothetical protein